MGVIIYRQTKRQDYYIQMNKEAGLANLNTSDLCRLCRGGSLLALSIGVSKLWRTFFFVGTATFALRPKGGFDLHPSVTQGRLCYCCGTEVLGSLMWL